MSDAILDGLDYEGVGNKNLLTRIQNALASPSLQRLQNAIPIFGTELDAIEKMSASGPESSTNPVWAEQAKNFLHEARYAAKARNAERDWRCLKAADRCS